VSSHLNLCWTFVDCAVRTWHYIYTGAAIGLVPGEETLTDLNLLEIQARHPRLVKVWKFSRYREARQSGAEWEWWIGSRSRWVGMRVQAKIVKPTTTPAQLAKGLQYKGGRQLRLLLTSSRRDGLFPLYCFYNARSQWVTGRCTRCLPFPQVFGCAIASATKIKSALDAKQPAHILDACRPWSCLVCPDCHQSRARSLAEQAYEFLSIESDGIEFDVDVEPLRDRPPDYLQALRNGMRPERTPEVARLLLIEEPDEA
jgi:hypothetical protein